MKILLFVVYLFPFVAFSQAPAINTLKILDNNGVWIKGDDVSQFYHGNILLLTTNWNGANNSSANSTVTGAHNGGMAKIPTINSQFSFTMRISAASGIFKQALLNGSRLKAAEMVVYSNQPKGNLIFKQTMEDLIVTNATESKGCDGYQVSSIVLQANRIKWTYYNPPNTKGEVGGIASETGWDFQKNARWY